MRKKTVGVIGGHDCKLKVEETAQELGKKLAKVVDIIVCGGLSGVMEAVCSGFSAAGAWPAGGKRKKA